MGNNDWAVKKQPIFIILESMAVLHQESSSNEISGQHLRW